MPDEQRPEAEQEQIRCKRCGESLHGREPGANCLACGSPVSISLPVEFSRGTPIPEFLTPTDLRCSRCGESLSGVARSGRCPRCEMPVSQSLAAGGWRSVVGTDGVVQSDTACRKCGYNLRGLPESGNCPECATAVALSTRGDFLCYADPAWSRKIARGSTWICRGMVSVVVSILSILVLALGMGLTGSVLAAIPLVIGALAFAGGLILIYIGAWIITIPDPAQPPHASGVTARKLIRIGLLMFVLQFAVDAIAENLPLPPAVMIAVTLLDIPMLIMGVVAVVAYYGYLAMLTARIPNDALSRRAKSLKWWIGWGLGIVLSLAVFESLQSIAMFGPVRTPPAAASGNAPSGALGIISGCFGSIGALILFVSGIVAIRLQWQVSKAAREQAKRAEANWTGAPQARPANE